MAQIDLKEILAIYGAVEGIASKLPDGSHFFYEHGEVKLFTDLIGRLNSASGKNYDQFTPTPEYSKDGTIYYSREYSQKVLGLLNTIREVYLPDRPAPFSGSPAVSVTQNVTTEIKIQIAVEMTTAIDKLLSQDLPPKEKEFLTKIKDILHLSLGVVDLFGKIAQFAVTYGITAARLSEMFGKLIQS